MKAILLFLTTIIALSLSFTANSLYANPQVNSEPPPVKGQGICANFPDCENTNPEQEPPTKVA